jgi:hypothetical protein
LSIGQELWEAEKRGLNFLAGASDPMGIIGAMYQSLFTQYAENLNADVDWAGDWNVSDELHSRLNERWVAQSLIVGAAQHFGLDWMLVDDGLGESDDLPSEDVDSDNPATVQPAMAGVTRPPTPWVGGVRRTITKSAYKKAVKEFRAGKYRGDARARIKNRLNPIGRHGQPMAIHHRTALAH